MTTEELEQELKKILIWCRHGIGGPALTVDKDGSFILIKYTPHICITASGQTIEEVIQDHNER